MAKVAHTRYPVTSFSSSCSSSSWRLWWCSYYPHLGLVGDVQIPVQRAVVGKAKGNISGENQLNPFSVLMGFVEDRHQTTAYIYPAMHECQHCAVKINKLLQDVQHVPQKSIVIKLQIISQQLQHRMNSYSLLVRNE